MWHADWTTVLEMIYRGLTQGDYICDYIDLHRKWFDQCGSSLEYTSLEYGLASNLLKALRQFFATRAFVSNAYKSRTFKGTRRAVQNDATVACHVDDENETVSFGRCQSNGSRHDATDAKLSSPHMSLSFYQHISWP